VPARLQNLRRDRKWAPVPDRVFYRQSPRWRNIPMNSKQSNFCLAGIFQINKIRTLSTPGTKTRTTCGVSSVSVGTNCKLVASDRLNSKSGYVCFEQRESQAQLAQSEIHFSYYLMSSMIQRRSAWLCFDDFFGPRMVYMAEAGLSKIMQTQR
jgi:hypothetical protein